jgi:glutamate carboxypeptidase
MTSANPNSYFRQRQADILATIGQLVTHETPSQDKPRLDTFADLLAARLTGAGATVEIIAQPERGNHVRARFTHGNETEKPVLVLCHYDTVWPVGSLATHPFRVEEGKAYGPGIFDMQSSLALVEYAMGAVRDLEITLPRPVMVLITSDEEIGSGSSRALIEAEARQAAYVLVMESPLPGGVIKTARKGTGTFTVETIGRAAHAGVDPYKGVNAIAEMAHQVLAIHALADREAGTTLSVGMIEGGVATNVVPSRARAQVDVRSWTQAEADRIAQALTALTPVLPGAQIVVSGGWNRPPLERRATATLFARVQEIGRALRMELVEGSTGGGSDGNFTGALGVPTLDGLGVPGDGAHADHEHILVEEIAGRAALLVAMWKEL